MPSFQVAFECTSPVLSYDRDWSFGTSSGDRLADRYTQASFILTQTANARMTFAFNGSSVSVIGAKRGNHGRYQGQIDNDTGSRVIGDGAATPERFNDTLYTWSGSNGRHTLTFENLDDEFLDVDYMAVTMSAGGADETLITDTYQETSSAFSFSPSGSWRQPSFPGIFSGGGGLVTSDTNAVAQFTFKVGVFSILDCLVCSWYYAQGDGVALYGPVGNGHRVSYSVAVDNGAPTVFRPPPANPEIITPKELLFITSGLGSGTHTLSIKVAEAPPSGQVFAIDYADVFTTSSIGSSLSSTTNTSPGSNSTPNPSQSPSGGGSLGDANTATLGESSDLAKFKVAVAATSTIAGLALAALIIAILIFRQRLRAAREPKDKFYPSTNSTYSAPGVVSPALPMQNGHISGVSPVGGMAYMTTTYEGANARGGPVVVMQPQMMTANGAVPVVVMGGGGMQSYSDSVSGATSAYGGMASTRSDTTPDEPRVQGKRQLMLQNEAQDSRPPEHSLPAYSQS